MRASAGSAWTSTRRRRPCCSRAAQCSTCRASPKASRSTRRHAALRDARPARLSAGGRRRTARLRLPTGRPALAGADRCDAPGRHAASRCATCPLPLPATAGTRHAHGAGRRWSHTIDPRSGEPASHRRSPRSACCTATACRPTRWQPLLTVLGPQAGLAFAERHALAALFVVREAGRLAHARQPGLATQPGRMNDAALRAAGRERHRARLRRAVPGGALARTARGAVLRSTVAAATGAATTARHHPGSVRQPDRPGRSTLPGRPPAGCATGGEAARVLSLNETERRAPARRPSRAVHRQHLWRRRRAGRRQRVRRNRHGAPAPARAAGTALCGAGAGRSPVRSISAASAAPSTPGWPSAGATREHARIEVDNADPEALADWRAQVGGSSPDGDGSATGAKAPVLAARGARADEPGQRGHTGVPPGVCAAARCAPCTGNPATSRS